MSASYPANERKSHENSPCATSFDDFKNALGDMAVSYTDAQIDRLRIAFDKMADFHFDNWLKRQNASMVVRDTQS